MTFVWKNDNIFSLKQKSEGDIILSETKISKIHNSNINIASVDVVFKERKQMPWKHDRKVMHHNHISLIIEGSMNLTVNGKTIEVNAGELSYVQKGNDFHSRSLKLPFSFISIEFEAYEDETFNFEFKPLCKISNPDKLHTAMEELYTAWHDKREGALLRQKALMYQVMDCILKEYSQTNEKYELKKIRKAIDYMEKNYLNSYTDIKTLSDMCGMSVSSFTRTFKNIYHTTPTKYMNLLRIERAKKYLSKTDMQIAAIAEACGFTSTYYFSRLFKQITEETPLKYRQKMGEM